MFEPRSLIPNAEAARYRTQIDDLLYNLRLREALIRQHQKYFDYSTGHIKSEFIESINCPVCSSKEAVLYFEKDLFCFNKCNDCGMIYLNPRLNVKATYEFYNEGWTAVYNERKFNGEGAGVASRLDDQINQANLELLEAHFPVTEGSKPRLLELGFGNGFFLKKASSLGYDVFGVDVDKSNCENLQKYFGDHILNSDLYEARFQSDTFEVVYLRDVFEHVPNPKELLIEINRVLKPGGIVYIEVPNIEALIYKIVKQRHTCVFGFAHLNYWSPSTVDLILEKTGFQMQHIAHKSLDFTLREIASYFLHPPFTAIVPMRTGRWLRYLSWMVERIFSQPGFRKLDRLLTPKIADLSQKGSVIKVLAKKI